MGQAQQGVERRPLGADHAPEFGKGHGVGRAFQVFQPIARGDLSRLEHPVVPAGQAVLADEGRDALASGPRVDLPARRARLRNLDACAANPEDIADADVALGQAACRNVFAEAARREVQGVGEGCRQLRVVLGRIVVQCLAIATMHAAVRLGIAGEAF